MKRKIYLNKVSLEKALQEYLGLFRDKLLPGERVKTTEAAGRVTAEPVYARRSAPHFYASAMDGIAVRAVDTAGASERQPIKLKEGKEAWLVDTGDPLPEGTNAVIMIEEVNRLDEGFFLIEKGATPWQHVRSIGESVVRGELILPVNHQLKYYDLGALLEAGVDELLIRKEPRVGIIPTGSELIPPGNEPARGELIDFNSSMLASSVREWGGKPSVSDIIRDDYQEIKQRLKELIKENDLVITIAGSSAGREDYTVKILEELGRIVVHGVNIMPGKPVILAVVDGKPVIGIPGYPLAALLNNHLFVRSLLFQLSGLPVPKTPVLEAELRRKVPSKVGLAEFLRVNLAQLGERLVAVPGKRGSSAMTSLLKADGILVVPEKKEGLSPGSSSNIFLLKPEEEVKNNLLLIGSHDLSLDIVINQLAEQRAGFSLNIQAVGSMAGLMALKRNECHLAGAHLLDPESGEYNRKFVEQILPGKEMALLNLVYREQGLMVKPGNPKGIKGIDDLLREDVTYLNRQRGAGTRVLFDYLLQENNISPEEIKGYDREEYTHIGAAVAVASGAYDAALGIRAAAVSMGLDFIPVSEERYDLVLPGEMLADRRILKLKEIITSAEFKEKARSLGGYRTESSGEIREL